MSIIALTLALIATVTSAISAENTLHIELSSRRWQQPYLFSQFDERRIAIKIVNSSELPLILDETQGVRIQPRSAESDILLAELHPPVEPLQLEPHEEITLFLDLASSVGAHELPINVLISVRAHFLNDKNNLIEATSNAEWFPPPLWFVLAKQHWLALIVIVLLLRLLLYFRRVSQRRSSRWQRLPTNTLEEVLLRLGAYFASCIGSLPWPYAWQWHWITPHTTLLRHYSEQTDPKPSLVLPIIKAFDSLVKYIYINDIPPLGLVFIGHWHAAECLRKLGISATAEYRSTLALDISNRYKLAAQCAGEPSLQELCEAMMFFYREISAPGKNSTEILRTEDRVPCDRPAQTIRWAAELLRVGPAKLRTTTPIPFMAVLAPLEWVEGGAQGWPPPLVERIDASLPLAHRTDNRRIRMLFDEGNLFGAINIKFELPLFNNGFFTNLSAVVFECQVTAELMRFYLSLPLDKKTRDRYLKNSEQLINTLSRFKITDQITLGLAAWSGSAAAELCLSIGDYDNVLPHLYRFNAIFEADAFAIRSRSLAERVRGDLYRQCGASSRAEISFRKAAEWWAVQSEWTECRMCFGLAWLSVIDRFEQNYYGVNELRHAISNLQTLEYSASQFVRKGYSALFHSMASWGRYLLAANEPKKPNESWLDESSNPSPIDIYTGLFIAKILRLLPKKLHRYKKINTFYFNAIEWRARRWRHRINAFASVGYFVPSSKDIPTLTDSEYRITENILQKKQLDIPESLRHHALASIRFLRLRTITGEIPVDTAVAVVEEAISATENLVAERHVAPTESLQSSAGVQRTSVLDYLLEALCFAAPIALRNLEPERWTRMIARARTVMCELRLEGWENIGIQPEIGTSSIQIEQLGVLQARLVAVRDSWLVHATDMDISLAELTPYFPELSDEPTFDALETTLAMVQKNLAEAILRQRENKSRSIVRKSSHNLDTSITAHDGEAWVEYVITPRQAGAFVSANGGKVRFIALKRTDVPNFGQSFTMLMRNTRAARFDAHTVGRGVSKTKIRDDSSEKSFNAEIANFDETLAKLAEAYWPSEIDEIVCDSQVIRIAPWGDLWRIPFLALPVPGYRCLVERQVVIVTPTLSGCPSLSQITPEQPEALAAVIAYDAHSNTERQLVNLPHEIAEIRRILPDATILEEETATPARALELMHHCRWLHFACHGISDHEAPLFSRLILAPEANCKDGSLYLHQLNLSSAQLEGVFICACESHMDNATHDRPQTLAIAFLAAGAHVVIGTLGEVFDDVALDVAKRFYKFLRQHSPEESITLALRELICSEPERFVAGTSIPISHPLAWWPFILLTA